MFHQLLVVQMHCTVINEEHFVTFQKEAERRAAEGLPPLGDEDEDDQFHDPFAMHRAPSQEDEDEGGHGGDTKDKISWSYSSYMAALHREDILNNTDESTFSSLMSDTGTSNSSSLRIQTGCTAAGFHWNLTLTRQKIIFNNCVYLAIAWSLLSCLVCFV